jgi:hypothetical protein
MTAIKNRLRDTDRFAWPGLEQIFGNIYSPSARFFRRTWYDPAQVVDSGLERFRSSLCTFAGQEKEAEWVENLFQLAIETLQLYGATGLDYALLQQQVCRELEHLEYLEQRADAVWRDTVRPLYHQLHPSRHLETLYGVGEQGAAVYASFIRRAERFPDQRHFRGWHGLIPDSRQSGDVEGKGLHISQAGPDLIKKFGYLNAQIARQYDPQIAAIYYDQMVHKGNHHNQAVCACATHLLDRVYVVLKQDRPYELRDVDQSSVTPEQARSIVAEHYIVPTEVRQRSNRRARKARAERRIERKQKTKGSCPRQ